MSESDRSGAGSSGEGRSSWLRAPARAVVGALGAAATVARPFTSLTPVLVNALLHQLVGRRLTLRYGGGDVVLTVQLVEAATMSAGLAAGHLGEVRLAATDLSWPGGRLERVAVTADDVRLRTPALATDVILAAVSVDIAATIDAEQLSGWLPVRRRVDLRIGSDGVLRAALRSAPWLGGIELEPQVSESEIWLRPRAVRMGRRLRLPIWLPAYRLRLPQLPHRMRVTAVECGPATITVSGVIPRWERALSATVVAQLLARPASLSEPVGVQSSGEPARAAATGEATPPSR